MIKHKIWNKAATVAGVALMIGAFGTMFASADTSGSWVYSVNGDQTATITGYNGSDLEVTIPATLGGRSVSAIGNKIFNNKTVMTVTISDGITAIDAGAFADCADLSTITLPTSVASIGDGAFSNCSNLTQITLPYGVKSLGESVFTGCDSLSGITIGAGLNKVAPSTFDGADNLVQIKVSANNNFYQSIDDILFSKDGKVLVRVPAAKFGASEEVVTYEIPSSVTSISDHAFYGVWNLAQVNAPDSLTKIGDKALAYMDELTSFTCPEHVTSIGGYAFEGCIALKDVYAGSSLKDIGTDAFVTSITWDSGTGALGMKTPGLHGYANSYLETYAKENGIPFSMAVLSGSCGTNAKWQLDCATGEFLVTGTGAMAEYQYSTRTPWFKYRDRIQTVNVASGITTIGTNCFYGCENLREVTGCVGVTDLGINAFRNCTSLVKVAGCTKAKQVQQYAFCGSPSIETFGNTNGVVDLPACEKIGGYAFYQCASIKTVKTYAALTYLGTRAFSNATSLTSATIGANCATIGSFSFCGCTSLTTMYGCAGVTGIGQSAFNTDAKLTTVQGLSKITSVGHRAFQNCTTLKTIGSTSGAVTLNNVIGIGDYAFSGCKALTKFTAGANLKQIGTYAFQNDTAMASLYLKTTKLTTVGDYALKGIKSNCIIYVPSASLTSYKNGVLKGRGQASAVVIKAY